MLSVAVRRLRETLQRYERVTRGEESQPLGADFRSMRESNRQLVLNCVRERGPLARVALAQETGLSRSTVGSIIDTLLSEGFVREGSALSAAPVGGRRAIEVHFNADAATVLGLELGRSHFTLVLTNLAGSILATHTAPLDVRLGADVCLSRVISAVPMFLSAQGAAWDEVAGMGIAIPGPIGTPTQTLIEPGILATWADADLRREFRNTFDVPTRLDNDANMGALAESRHGAGRGIADLAYIKLGTGIGCGLVVNGEVYRGSVGASGELGHLSILSDGPRCVCGHLGCLEALAGTAVIIRDAREGISWREARLAVERGMGAPADPCRGVSSGADDLTLAELASLSDGDFAAVVKAARDGNPSAIAAVQRAGERLGVAVAALVNLVNPSLILLGSGAALLDDVLLEPLRRTAASRCLPSVWARTRVASGMLGASAVALGAATAVIDAAFTAPPTWHSRYEHLASREEVVGTPSAAGMPEIP